MGFSYGSNNGSYEISVEKDFDGNCEPISAFAEEYWNTPKGITLYLSDGVELKKVVDSMKGWMMLQGVEKYKPNEVLALGDKRADTWANMYQLIHVTTHQAVENMKIRVK